MKRSRKKLIVVAIDEFQQIGSYPEKNVEALIRGLIQTLSNTRFIFSGSNKSILSRMFGDATRPFYQSTEMIYLSEIPRESYARFISSQFKKDSRQVEEGAIGDILSWCRCHTWYVQYVCNKLYETGNPVNLTNASTVKRGVVALFEKEMIFRTDDQYFVYDVFFSRWLEGVNSITN